MAAPSVVQTAGNNSGVAGTTISCTLGATPTAGNLLIAFVSVDGTNYSPSISGWSMRRATRHNAMFTKLASGGESTTVTCSMTSQGHRSMTVIEISGAADIGTEGDIYTYAEQRATATTQTIPSVTPLAGNDCLLIASCSVAAPQGITVNPSGYTNHQDQGVGGGERLSLHTKQQTNPSGSYSSSITYAGSVTSVMLHIVVHGVAQAATTIARVQRASDTPGVGVSVTSLTAVLGATPAVGSLLVLDFMMSNATSPTLPSGWTKIVDALGATTPPYYLTIATKVAGASEPTSIQVTFPSNDKSSLRVQNFTAAYYGVNTRTNPNNVAADVLEPVASVTPPTDEHVGLLAIYSYSNATGVAIHLPGYNVMDEHVGNTGGASSRSVSELRLIRQASGAYAPSYAQVATENKGVTAQLILVRQAGLSGTEQYAAAWVV